jgi:uncharacterized protein YndB with AHSA1/START domain
MSPNEASPLDGALLMMSRVFDADPEAVFDAWTQKDAWQAWIGPEGVDCEVTELDARVGGRFRLVMHMSGGRAAPVAGEFREVERPGRLVFTWGLEGRSDQQSLITLTFRGADGKTDFTLRQEGLGDAVNRDAHGAGWASAFNKLDRHLARS